MTILQSKFVASLSVVLLVGALFYAIALVHRLWRERQEEYEDPVTTEELLDQFKEAHAVGELDDAEFRRVTDLLRNSGAGAPSAPRSKPIPPPPDARPEEATEDTRRAEFS